MPLKTGFFSALLACALLLSLFVSANAQVRVVKKAIAGNPKLAYRGVAGNSELSLQIGSDLKNCGWFDIASGRKADYTISGKANNSSVVLSIYNGNGSPLFSVSGKVYSRNIAWSAHRAVDRILKKIFGINGICSTRIAFCLETSRGVKNIYICDFDGNNLRRITSTPSLCVEPDWFPDAASLVYTMYRGASTDIVQTNISAKKSRVLASSPGLNSGGAVSPNGKMLTMILSQGKRVDLYVKYLNGRGLKRLTNSRTVEASPCWSPTGSKICFVSDTGGSPKLYLISANGGRYKRLSALGIESVSPDWSSDNKIAYAAKMGRNYSIAVLDLSRRGVSGNVISAAGDWESPSWAPDNRHVVCSRKLNGKSSLYVIDTWTGNARKVAGGKYNLGMPSWSPPH